MGTAETPTADLQTVAHAGRQEPSQSYAGSEPRGPERGPANRRDGFSLPAARTVYPWDWWTTVPARSARRIIGRIGCIPTRVRERWSEERIVSLVPPHARGSAVLSYVLLPFLLADDQPLPNTHTQYWETRAIAEALLAEGFAVDVISYQNRAFLPRKQYDFLIDVRWNIERLADSLGPDCRKIFHIDMAHFLYHNQAEAQRLLDLQKRRGVTLASRRHERPNHGIEFADCATMLGNAFTESTYRYANKPIHRVPATAPVLWPAERPKNFDACRMTFLWLGTRGLVHKGLDLVLEAFAAMPQYKLIVCGPIDSEADFAAAYHHELYETENIRTFGWVDIGSRQFRELTDSCIALVFPSCSEGQSGSAVTCLHAGLIPIVSYQTGVDVDPDFGTVLQTCSIDEIKAAVDRIANLPTRELREMSDRALHFARTHHTRERFRARYRQIIHDLVEAPAAAGV